MSPKKTIGFIGFGEVAMIYGKLLKEQNWTVFVYDHRYGEESTRADSKRNKAKQLGIEYVPSLEVLVHHTSNLLSTVTPSSASQIAKNISLLVSKHHVFLDLNSTNPKVKMENSKYFQAANCPYLDGVIMRSPQVTGSQTPIYYSGEIELHHLPSSVFHLKRVGQIVGQASAMKMCQSIITKGIQCLVWEQILLAEKWNIQQIMAENLDELFLNRSYSDWVDYAITSNIIHSKRRQQEIGMAVDFLKEMNFNAFQSEAICQTLNWISEQNLHKLLDEKMTNEEFLQFIISEGSRQI
ncbi:NAD(P)-binding domain-containing protein [Neobacillus rhizophilus]|uniref:NAD(P)-dependent oxidoreductase n=1 Tax=Neobacillus rhizophilus TaxID=2833579 RepID=A0A942U979_9BACI|nr:NAD(P)-binding domain-containing protein [Neobacillus rhizophilus]MBS4214706.1 NAD(P)-dependent oxidoreductase [Neobacillus rhizophilus]